jgi:hypothetical protein
MTSPTAPPVATAIPPTPDVDRWSRTSCACVTRSVPRIARSVVGAPSTDTCGWEPRDTSHEGRMPRSASRSVWPCPTRESSSAVTRVDEYPIARPRGLELVAQALVRQASTIQVAAFRPISTSVPPISCGEGTAKRAEGTRRTQQAQPREITERVSGSQELKGRDGIERTSFTLLPGRS